MALEDYQDLVNSVNQFTSTLEDIRQKKEEQKRYEEQKKFQEKWTQKNYELQSSAFNYQKELNSLQQQREDSAIRRQLNDYTKAGLSPLSVVGSTGATSGSLTSLSAPQYETSGSNNLYSSRESRLSSERMQKKQLSLERTNQVLSGIKLGNEILSSKIEREKLKSEKDAIDSQREWNEKNGYRNQDWQSALIPIIKNYLENKTPNQIVDDVEKTISTVSSSANHILNETTNKALSNISNEETRKKAQTYLALVRLGLYERVKKNPVVIAGKMAVQSLKNILSKSNNPNDKALLDSLDEN